MPTRQRAGLFRYLKEAFTFRWNLLVFGGGAIAAAMSGHPDIAIPLVAAAEVTFLAGLATLPRFQAAIDAKAHGETGTTEDAPAARVPNQAGRDRIIDVLKSLSEDRRSRFLRLRARCVEMARIANAVRGETRDTGGAATELRTPALDRLLWVFLKLLLSEQAISRFLQATDEAQIDRTLADLADKVTKRTAAVAETDRADDRLLHSLQDSVATATLRKENVVKSKSNAEFIAAELDRLENKIQAVTEMAVSHADPNEMSSKIDAIADGISQTEETIRELQTLTGMSTDSETPSILDGDIAFAGTARPPATPVVTTARRR